MRGCLNKSSHKKLQGLRKVIFLDRDGVINECAPPHCYISRWEEFKFLPGVIQGIKKLNDAGYLVLLVTNQRGIARGLLNMRDVEELHRRLCEHLGRQGAHLDGIYICPHEDGECHCRKPEIGMFLRAEKDFKIDKEKSYCIGDSSSDVQAGKRYGVATILIGDKKDDFGQDYTFQSLREAVEVIVKKGFMGE